VLLALVDKGLAREEAYKIVQSNASKTWEENKDFRELLRSDAQAGEHLSGLEFDELFDYAYFTRYVDVTFARLGLIEPVAKPEKAATASD
jgi:adenylosuccinate lyase